MADDNRKGEIGNLEGVVIMPDEEQGGEGQGRPSIYTDELATQICLEVIAGSNLYKICQAEDMPNRDTVYSWLANKQDFSDNYARACKIRREDKFEKLEQIAETEADVNRARLKVDVIKWQLSKEEPRKYGDKLDLTTGNEKLNRGMSDAELNAILARATGTPDQASASAQA